MATALLHPHLCRIKSTQTFYNRITCTHCMPRICILCSDSSSRSRGFGSKSRKTDKKEKKSSSGQQSSTTSPNQVSDLSSPTTDGKVKYTSPDDLEFQQRLQAVRESALAQKKAEEEKLYGAIDYDAPPPQTNNSTIGLGTKIGVGVAVIAFGLVFALGDFFPSGSITKEADMVGEKISEEERANLEKQLKSFEQTLATSPEDSTALEGAAVTLAEMREYKRAAALLEKLTEQKKPSDPDVFRLLGEVKYELKDYEGSAAAYRSAIASKSTDFEVLRGLMNALLAAKKPDEAVQMLKASRETRSDVDSIQVDLLLGKAYSDWGHLSDAVAVYDQIISNHPDDFRGYLAKGIILKRNGSNGDAERMFIQARFYAPEKAKVLVDNYARQ